MPNHEEGAVQAEEVGDSPVRPDLLDDTTQHAVGEKAGHFPPPGGAACGAAHDVGTHDGDHERDAVPPQGKEAVWSSWDAGRW